MIKKLILAALILSVAFGARAQMYLGGNLGLETSSDNRIGVLIAPEIGYRLNTHLTVGGTISYRSLQNSFGITPYLRGDLVNIQNIVRVFISAQAPCRFTSNYQSYGAYLRPGVTLRLVDGVWMQIHVGAFGYSYTRINGTGYGGWYAQVNSNTVNVGFCFGIGV